MTYNGWTNWETWNLHLWLTNDEGSYRFCESLAEGKDLGEAAEALRETVENMADSLGIGPSWASDFINAGLASVDWRELAESFQPETNET